MVLKTAGREMIEPNKHGIDSSKVTKPIQLLAAWLIGLIVSNASFLAAASMIKEPTWASGLLVISTVANVPLFLVCLFLLQTKFRPEMQEDQYYAQYLESRYSVATDRNEVVRYEMNPKPLALEAVVVERTSTSISPRPPSLRVPTEIWINDLLPNYTNILEDLRQHGIMPNNIFGRNATEPEVPNPFIISTTENPDMNILSKVVQVCAKYGLKTVRITRRNYDGNRIYIGSFSYRAYPVEGPVPRTDIIQMLSQGDLGWDQVREWLPIEPE